MKVRNSKQTRALRPDAVAPQDGSIELVVLGMLAALIVVLAIPLFIDVPAREGTLPGTPEETLENDSIQQIPSSELEISPSESA